MLPNLDDDARRCPRRRLERFTNNQLAGCNDASDDVVDGPKDVADMAPVRVAAWTQAPSDTQARITVHATQPGRARLFVRRGGVWTSLGSGGSLSPGELRRGPQLLLEGRDIIRDPARWDGSLRVDLRVEAKGRAAKDSVRFRVAPVLFQNHLMPLQRVFVASRVGPLDDDAESEGTPVPKIDQHERPIGTRTFAALSVQGRAEYLDEYRTALHEGSNGVGLQLLPTMNDDRWIQDFYEPGYVSMPAPGGTRTR
ncbi:MAG TPA: protein-arginine deiminase family protein [Solirubrobacteraceae bacterium]|nr:protein-arginine deiminase family protein [Solirubrobacteraceae bacterium]